MSLGIRFFRSNFFRIDKRGKRKVGYNGMECYFWIDFNFIDGLGLLLNFLMRRNWNLGIKFVG